MALGRRGLRSRETVGGAWRLWLAFLALTFAAAALIGVALAPAALAPLLAPCALGAVAMALAWRRAERSLTGELLACSALAAWAFPVGCASGLPVDEALLLAGSFATMFSLLTSGVRALIGHARQPELAKDLRAAGAIGALFALADEGLLIGTHQLPESVLAASLPVALLAAALTLFPPSPRRLRTVGWISTAASVWMALVIAL